ncbi:MAG: alpha/beta fold hydrolase [Magnetococcales bacterium]|nr:alpha/beta fold hydrolase [Magnetococcales bacterium]
MKKESVIDHPLLISYMFYPMRTRYRDSYQHIHTVNITVEDGITLASRFHFAGTDCPTILFWHGNGEVASQYDHSQEYVEMGINFLAVDFRGYGESEGIPTGSNLLHDAITVYEKTPNLLKEIGIVSEQLYIMGRSLGCTAAVEVGRYAQGNISGLILESGRAFTVPVMERIGGFDPKQMEESLGFKNHEKIADIAVPTLIIHGEKDEIIPVSDAKAMYENSAAKAKKLVKIANAGHNDLMMIGHDEYYAAIRNFIF